MKTAYGADNVVYVTDNANKQFSLKFANGQSMKAVDVGGTLVAAESIDTFKDDAVAGFDKSRAAAVRLRVSKNTQ